MAKATQQTFPKVKTTGTVTDFTKKKGCCNFKLSGVKITGWQFEHIGDMIDEGDAVTITLQKQQGTIPFDEDEPKPGLV